MQSSAHTAGICDCTPGSCTSPHVVIPSSLLPHLHHAVVPGIGAGESTSRLTPLCVHSSAKPYQGLLAVRSSVQSCSGDTEQDLAEKMVPKAAKYSLKVTYFQARRG